MKRKRTERKGADMYSKRLKFNDIEVGLQHAKMRMAIVQAYGPFPAAKAPIVQDEGRSVLAWPATEETRARGAKVLNVLGWLHENEPKIDVVVFPEYSFPIRPNLDELQKRANDYNFIIVAGADSIDDKTKSYNRTAILLPKAEPVWVGKRSPSQWESPHLSPVEPASIPRFIWKANGTNYWFLIYICLDFLDLPIEDAVRTNLHGPGVFIVPICSEVMIDFQLTAATLLRREGGTATILCNCVGGKAAGLSAIHAVHPGLRKLQPVLSLPQLEESIAIFDIDLKNLVPPKVAKLKTRAAVQNIKLFGIRSVENRLDIAPLSQEQGHPVTRGVINPTIFNILGKKLRVAFLEVQHYPSTRYKLTGQSFETLAVLGHCDLIVTHVHQDRKDMVYDIVAGGIPLRAGSEFRSIQGLQHTTSQLQQTPDISFFEVEKFYKVLGLGLDPMNEHISLPPSADELAPIVALAANWDDPTIKDEMRTKCLDRKWILQVTDRKPGEISAIIAIALGNRELGLANRLRQFQYRILPRIVASESVTSAYGGTGIMLNIDYLIRVTTDVKSLFRFIEELHKWTEDERELISTSTFVVIDRLSDLDLSRVLIIEALPEPLAIYAHEFFHPHLSGEDRLRFTSLPRSQQESVLDGFRKIDQMMRESLNEERTKKWMGPMIKHLERSLAAGMFYFFYSSGETKGQLAFPELKIVHDSLQTKVEEIISEIIEKEVSDDIYEEAKSTGKIPSQKKKSELSYTDKVKLLIEVTKAAQLRPEMLASLQVLFDTTRIRNIIAHAKKSELEALGIMEWTEALVRYLQFLHKWG